jgi:hypothetical protein
MRAMALLVAASLAGVAAPTAAEDATVRVSPRFATDGSTVVVTVKLDPDPSLRSLLVEADSEAMFRSSLVQLDGDRSAAVHTLRLRSLPAGDYDVRVVIDRAAMGEDGPGDAMLYTKFRIVN